ncbi:unnamed protein product [Calypogeia fissa]
MRPSMPRRTFRSGSSSFSRGARPLEQNVSVKKKQTAEDFSKASFATCALRTEIKTSQHHHHKEESPAASTIAGRHAPIVERSQQQQALNSREASLALPEPSAPPSLSRPTSTRKAPPTKGQKLENALLRVRNSRDPVSALANMAESLLTLIEPDERPAFADSGVQLVDNFAPVADECPPTSGLEVTGTIPECMNGIYVRNGSNPQFMPSGGYHVFDGDGMLHAVRIKDGIPSYCCRFTRTYRYLKEKAMGHTLYPYVMGELIGWIGLARLGLFSLRDKVGVLERSKGLGVANAGLAFYNGKLLAMSEDDMPYAVAISDDGDLETLGHYDISGSYQLETMTAHPKIDATTGEMFAYSYNVLEKPHVQYWRATAGGQMSPPVAINVKEPVLIHDFAVTDNYAIIPDPMMVFRLTEMLAGRSPVTMDEGKAHRFGVLPKYATNDSAMVWFSIPGVSCFHYLNAWEEGDEVVLIGSNNNTPSRVFNNPAQSKCFLTEFRLNLKTGRSSQRRVSEWDLDVGRINERFTGRKSRYVYLSMNGPWPKFSGIVKLDLQAPDGSAEVGVRKFPPGCYGSEPVFVPRVEGGGDADSEDDGYVVTYLHNENTNVSTMAIFDARSPTLEPVATVKLPARVPYGFHGIFLTEDELASQKRSPF